MAEKQTSLALAALRKLEASVHLHWRAHKGRAVRAPKPMLLALWRLIRLNLRRPLWRRSLVAVGAVIGLIAVVFGALWWRLASGPIELALATPWLTAAIEENFGSGYQVQVGGTQLERDGAGRIRLRLRDIVVRDADGAVAASAPKAEVGFSGAALLTGSIRAERLSLVGAEMAVRIEPGGNVTVFAGNDKHPIATASAGADMRTQSPPAPEVQSGAVESSSTAGSAKNAIENLSALLAWVDSLGASGLDGHDLAELGLIDGTLVVDDQRSGKRWSFANINLSLTRPRSGSVIFNVESESEDKPWSLSAAVAPSGSDRRLFKIEARRVPAKDLLLAMRLGEDPILADVPLSASLQAEIGADGSTQALRGRIIADAGSITDSSDPSVGIVLDRAEFNLEWDPSRRALIVPFQMISGGNRATLFAQIEPPRVRGGLWNVGMTGGTVVLGAGQRNNPALVFNRIVVRARIDPLLRRVILEQGDLANMDNAVAITGSLDYATADPRLALGIAATRMDMATMKKLWPSFVASDVRKWFQEHTTGGTVERAVIATNAPLSTLKPSGPPLPEDGLLVEVTARDTTLQAIETLPPIREAELNVRVAGRSASIHLNRGSVELPSGRKLTLTSGVFEVPDTGERPPASRARFRIEGPVSAAAELLEMERLRDFAAVPFDLSAARGTVTAQVNLAFPLKPDLPPGSSSYSVTADINNFAAERLIMAQKVEAQTLRITANNQGYQIKGDVKIAGATGALDYRKAKTNADAELRIQAVLDESARTKLGLDADKAVAGSVPVKLSGHVGLGGRESRFHIDADLTQARIENLLPGWAKPAGKASRATFTLINNGQSTRLDDVTIEGSGTYVKGALELDGSGEIVSAHFPVFNLAEGDKTGFKADRTGDGALRVSMRGEVHDGRGFIKTAMAGSRSDKGNKPSIDLDLDIKLGAVVGFNGETLRGVDLKLSRRAGNIRAFNMSAKLGRDALLVGDLRGRSMGRPVIYFETKDAGALFRFTDTYPRMVGGEMWVAMDSPTANSVAQEGILNIRNFAIRGEAALERVAGPANSQRDSVRFQRMRTEFTRTPGRLEIRDGVVQGIVGATIDGHINYIADEVHLRGSFVPLSQLNNMFGQLPIVGMLLGGGSEGLLGVTYEVVGPPSAPRLNVNPLSAVAPGLLRKFFEFRNKEDRGFEALR